MSQSEPASKAGTTTFGGTKIHLHKYHKDKTDGLVKCTFPGCGKIKGIKTPVQQ